MKRETARESEPVLRVRDDRRLPLATPAKEFVQAR